MTKHPDASSLTQLLRWRNQHHIDAVASIHLQQRVID
jgi:hypothetical protein